MLLYVIHVSHCFMEIFYHDSAELGEVLTGMADRHFCLLRFGYNIYSALKDSFSGS